MVVVVFVVDYSMIDSNLMMVVVIEQQLLVLLGQVMMLYDEKLMPMVDLLVQMFDYLMKTLYVEMHLQN
jgi:hypothetical protein